MKFRDLAKTVADYAGHPATFLVAAGSIVIWAALGPVSSFSETWQLTVNTGTTIVTFLMVFLIQSSQNRDTREIHLKLDELIRAKKDARNRFAHLEDATEEELVQLAEDFKTLDRKQ